MNKHRIKKHVINNKQQHILKMKRQLYSIITTTNKSLLLVTALEIMEGKNLSTTLKIEALLLKWGK